MIFSMVVILHPIPPGREDAPADQRDPGSSGAALRDGWRVGTHEPATGEGHRGDHQPRSWLGWVAWGGWVD